MNSKNKNKNYSFVLSIAYCVLRIALIERKDSKKNKNNIKEMRKVKNKRK